MADDADNSGWLEYRIVIEPSWWVGVSKPNFAIDAVSFWHNSPKSVSMTSRNSTTGKELS